jgi:hypothetical protein
MVHALKEIRRVLAPGGILIDLRPLSDEIPIEIVSDREINRAGMAAQMPEDRLNDEAANRATTEAESNHWFVKEAVNYFILHYTWASPTDMRAYVEAEWSEYAFIDEGTWQNIHSMWAATVGAAQIRIPFSMQIARWKASK